MKRSSKVLLPALAFVFLASCADDTSEGRMDLQVAQLGGNVAAKVGSEPILMESVNRIAEARKVSAQQARDDLIFDALVAQDARSRGLEQSDYVRVHTRGLLARKLLDTLAAPNRQRPVSADEVEEFTAFHWVHLNRPQTWKAVHAAVLCGEANAIQWPETEALAKKVEAAVAQANTSDAFIKAAQAVGAGTCKIIAQELEPVTEDARVADVQSPPGAPTRTYDPAFVKEIVKLADSGQKAPLFRSPFGVHVAMLVAIQPARILPFEQRKEALTDEIIATRTRRELEPLVTSLREQNKVVVQDNALNLMLKVGGIAQQP